MSCPPVSYRVPQKGWPSDLSSIQHETVKQFHSNRKSLAVVKGCLMMADRLVIPNSLRQRILKQLHRGHPGIERMKAVARSYVFWPKIDECITEYIIRCSSCAIHSKSPPKVSPQPWPATKHSWERIHLNFAGPFFNQHFLIVFDAHSKWPETKAVRFPTTFSVIEFLNELFSRFGVPETIVTDNGKQFTSKQFAALCKSNGIQHLRTAPYHPQSNGQAERFVETMKRSMLKIEEGKGGNITEILQTFLQTYRSTPILKGKSPAELMIGKKMRTTLDLLLKPQSHPSEGTLPSRRFEVDDEVYAKIHEANSWKWVPRHVIEAVGSVTYNVLLDSWHGRRKLIRSHVNQLKPRLNGHQETTNPSSPLNIWWTCLVYHLNRWLQHRIALPKLKIQRFHYTG
ncbi:uncharacterized protein K02A2.6-like [Uranotaenia lowii]|uniref:uncharacterized protein K02A2.6-like n=1 Tax=Uranotaenia lowii TaxID=190385 RepID=UPI002478B504|nr:uncharacterized protein K02A2.6-like [Uranotaenia lowii]